MEAMWRDDERRDDDGVLWGAKAREESNEYKE
jgi:hypothetical protein